MKIQYRIVAPLFLSAIFLAFSSCNQAPSDITNSSTRIQRTSEVQFTQTALNAQAPAILQNAILVKPIKLWDMPQKTVKASSEQAKIDGITLTFNDFFGSPFAHVTQVSRNGDTNIDSMLTAFMAKDKDEKGLYVEGNLDSKDWTIGTYVTGASTLRLVLGRTIYGFPILEGLYGKIALENQIPNNVKTLLMPDNNTFLAELIDGRYWDILAQSFVSKALVDNAKEHYRQMLEKMQVSTAAKSKSTSSWSFAKSMFGATIEPCVGQLCPVDEQTDIAQQSTSITTECYTWWILWWAQIRCKNHYYVYLNDDQLFPAMSKVLPSDPVLSSWQDNAQTIRYLDASNPTMRYLSGCSPTAIAELLIWFHYYKNVPTGRVDFEATYGGSGSNDNKWVRLNDFSAWQWDLRYAMWTTNQLITNSSGAFYQGGTYAFSIKPGANNLFAANGIGVRAHDMMIDALSAISKNNGPIKDSIRYIMGTLNLPMIISATPQWPSGHTGVAKSFDIDDDLQSIYGRMVNPPSSDYQGNIVFGHDFGSGVIWLQQYP